MGEKKIIAGVDLGPQTEPVSAYAFWLAKTTGTDEICLLHVIDYGISPPAYLAPYLAAERKHLEADLKTWTDRLRGLGAETEGRVAVGRLNETFHAEISSLRASTIVLGYKSHTLRASSSERLIRSLDIPLLIVRGRKAMDARLGSMEVKRILCAIDFSPHSLNALELARSIAKVSSGSIDILHVIKPLHAGLDIGDDIRKRYLEDKREEARRKMGALVGDGVRHAFVREGIPADVIATVADETDASMLFMGSRGRSDFKGLLLGSVTDALIKSSSCPVMVVR